MKLFCEHFIMLNASRSSLFRYRVLIVELCNCEINPLPCEFFSVQRPVRTKQKETKEKGEQSEKGIRKSARRRSVKIPKAKNYFWYSHVRTATPQKSPTFAAFPFPASVNLDSSTNHPSK